MAFRDDYEHLFWLAEHGGGDQIADANCWLDAKGSLAALLELAELADSLVRDLRRHRYLSRKNAAIVAESLESGIRRLKASR